MQLSSRILTALAVLILAVAVVAVRAGSPGTVEAATGTIDVLNVGTCYTTDAEVFEVGDCDDGDGAPYNVAERDSITETGTVFATYPHDPKTAPDDPRGILENANLIKISISDSGRDKRTPVLLAAGDALTANAANCTPGTDCLFDQEDLEDTPATVEKGYLQTIREDFDDAKISIDNVNMRWTLPNDQGQLPTYGTTALEIEFNGVTDGITILKNPSPSTNDDGTTPLVADYEAADYKPMDVADESLVSIYGTVTTTPADGGAATTEFKNLKNELTLDEDRGSGRVEDEGGDGRAEVAPWLSLQKSLAENEEVEVMYFIYHTSEQEVLIGANAETEYAAGVNTPDFTNAETKAKSELLLEARSDGRGNKQQLWLTETSRFSGRYEGYVQLTDENGIDPDAITKNATNWGRMVRDAVAATEGDNGAAIVGVESGPTQIAYKDTDGSTRLLSISIDRVPPTVQIDTPAHKSEGQDTSPNFAGSYTDDDSGLRRSTFRLYLHHDVDIGENGDDGTPALDLRVDSGNTNNDDYGVVTAKDGAKAVVESLEDYAGYLTTPEFGVIGHTDLFNVANDTTIKGIAGDNHDDGALSGTFGDSERISFEPENNYNDTIDFQALVADVAGNIGFSDSDTDGPRFINNLGELTNKRKTERYNVLGWYARHVFFLDETDPGIYQEQSVTGFYGEDDDDKPVVNRSGILVAFDRAVDPDSIGVETFSVTLDPDDAPGSTGATASVVDVDVDGRVVYLLLSEELASDATPSVDVPSGQWVSDPAGNRLTGGQQDAFDVKDGISPVLNVTLSGGSGTGEGDEGPSKLTKNAITVTIEADEEINSTPALVVVCSNIAWDSNDSDTEDDKGLSDLTEQRSGAIEKPSATFDLVPATDDTPARNRYHCGDDEVLLQQLQSYTRPGLQWEFEWVNFTDEERKLGDGKLSVVAFARDRQSYAPLTDRAIDADPTAATIYNWGATTSEFKYDKTLGDPEPTPKKDATVTEGRPFVLLTYVDESTISIDSFEVDGTALEISGIGDNRFLYWPETLSIGTHTVSVDAVDAAGNEDPFEYSFKVAERKPFNVKLIAGWNAVSFPANPADNAIASVFTEDVIDMVAGWDASDPEKPWSIATRMEGEWSTHDDFATLSKVHAQYGYWVHAQGFVTQRVKLIGGINRTDPEITPPDLVSIPTLTGWNFVGVIDQDGDQTEDNFGEVLTNGDTKVKAGDYLGSNKRAYTWDPIRSKFDIVEADDELEIGEGIWVYYGGGFNVAP